uniref:Uncharacterized protein n=1 Tax=Ditylenchus dipsaci TaxID=166011 RepID=A0A915EGQ6_9BILA
MKALSPLEAASRKMSHDSASIAVRFPIARVLSADMYALHEPQLQSMRSSILSSLVGKFDVENQRYMVLRCSWITFQGPHCL